MVVLVLALALAPWTAAQCNTPPTAVADSANTLDNKTLWIAPLANDSDPDGQQLTLTVVSENCPGTVTTDPAGLLIYTPTSISGPEQGCSINYKIADGAGSTATAVVSVTVTAVTPLIFADDFETADLTAWSGTE
jgi:hypothetical protein